MALFSAALLSKESAVGLLAFVGVELAASFSRKCAGATDRRRSLAAFALLLGVTAAYLLARLAVLGRLATPFPTAPSPLASLASVPLVVWAYLKLLLAPCDVALLHPLRPVASLAAPSALGAALALAVAVAASVVAIRRRPGLLAPLAWFGAWLAPHLQLWAVNPEWIVMSRYLFLPALALPWAAYEAVRPEPDSRRERGLLSAFVGVALLFSAVSLVRMTSFRDERAFWERMREADPTSSVAWGETGRILAAEGRRAEARRALETATRLDPAALLPRLRLALLSLEEGEAGEAAAALRRLSEASPGYAPAWRNLPIALERFGARADALGAARDAAARFPNDAAILSNLATLLRSAGLREEALDAISRARRARPRDATLAFRRAVLLAELGRRDEARLAVADVRTLAPDAELRRLVEALAAEIDASGR